MISCQPKKKLGPVLLFIPNTRWYGKRPWMIIPHSALALTRELRGKVDFHIIDANVENLSEEDSLRRVRALSPRVFLSSGTSIEYSMQYHAAFRIAKEAVPDCVTVFGGVYPTVLADAALEDDNIDFIFTGCAEGRVVEFVRLIMNRDSSGAATFPGVRHNGDVIGLDDKWQYGTTVSDLKGAISSPDYSLIDVKSYLELNSSDYNFTFDGPTAILLTSYGCPYDCVFCASKSISGGKVAFRSKEDVISEIAWFAQQHGVRNFSFLDECFLSDSRRAIDIMNGIMDISGDISWKLPNASAWHLDDEMLNLMKESGCRMLTVSVESGSERVLRDIIHKDIKLDLFPRIVDRCRELNIDIAANFVIGLPGESWDEIRETFRVAEELNFDLCSFHIATPYPKTDLYRIARDGGMLPSDFDFRNPKYYGTSQGFITTDQFTPYELMILRAFEWDRINFCTPTRVAKIASMMNMTVDELNEHRTHTRRKLGVHHSI